MNPLPTKPYIQTNVILKVFTTGSAELTPQELLHTTRVQSELTQGMRTIRVTNLTPIHLHLQNMNPMVRPHPERP